MFFTWGRDCCFKKDLKKFEFFMSTAFAIVLKVASSSRSSNRKSIGGIQNSEYKFPKMG